MLVFVYGTLKQGFSNHRILENAKARFFSIGYVNKKDIYYVYEDSFPAVIHGKGIVYGEIYEVKPWQLYKLDRLEGYRPNTKSGMYLRKKALATLPSGERVWINYYYWNRDVNQNLKIHSGTFPSEEERRRLKDEKRKLDYVSNNRYICKECGNVLKFDGIERYMTCKICGTRNEMR